MCGACHVGQSCVAGQCVDDCTPDCSGKTCGTDGCGGACGSCGTDQSCQGGQCVDNCTPDCAGKTCGGDGCGGSCGSCPDGKECLQGACVDVCPVGQTRCGDACVNILTDADNCGSCGHACSLPHATARCVNSVCAIEACDQGYADCDQQDATGCEAHLADDHDHCGACDHACAGNEVCTNGACVEAACVPELGACTAGGATCCNGRTCGGLIAGCGDSLRCCAAAGQECFNACDCCNPFAGCAFFNGGSNPGTCMGN